MAINILLAPGRAAAAMAHTLVPFCLPWDMEIEYHFRIHNISCSFFVNTSRFPLWQGYLAHKKTPSPRTLQ